eukprot:3941834-Rhodomonas_salina.1
MVLDVGSCSTKGVCATRRGILGGGGPGRASTVPAPLPPQVPPPAPPPPSSPPPRAGSTRRGSAAYGT